MYRKRDKSRRLPDGGRKLYRGELTLGIATDTQDSCGKVLSVENTDISEKMLLETADAFKGSVMQLPPMYSALRVEGRRLYDLARLDDRLRGNQGTLRSILLIS